MHKRPVPTLKQLSNWLTRHLSAHETVDKKLELSTKVNARKLSGEENDSINADEAAQRTKTSLCLVKSR